MKCLPLALLRIQTAPRKDVGVSPCEILFGLLYKGNELPQFETKDAFLKNYILRLLSSLSSLRTRGLLAQIPPLAALIHPFRAGDWVLMRTWREFKLESDWEGLFQVLLTTETKVRMAEKGWTHTWVKASVNPDT